MERYVIQYQDGAYNRGDGYAVDRSQATVYETKQLAEEQACFLMGATVVAQPEPGALPYTPEEWNAGIEGLEAPKAVLERLEATIRALAWARET